MPRFKPSVMMDAFKAAPTVPGRSPSRWRYDVNGREVFVFHRGRTGITGWQADHVVPIKEGGSNTIENCQILQGMANLRKSSNILTPEELKMKASNMRLTPKELDLIELSTCGNILDENEKEVAKILSVEEAISPSNEKADNFTFGIPSATLGPNVKINGSCSDSVEEPEKSRHHHRGTYTLTRGVARAALAQVVKNHGIYAALNL